MTPLSSRLSCIPQTVRHGFPYQPSSMAFDPVQKILAIGTQSGALRLYPLNQCCRSLRLLSATASPGRQRQVSLCCCSHGFTHTCWGVTACVCVCVRLMKRLRPRSWFSPSPGRFSLSCRCCVMGKHCIKRQRISLKAFTRGLICSFSDFRLCRHPQQHHQQQWLFDARDADNVNNSLKDNVYRCSVFSDEAPASVHESQTAPPTP